MLISKRDCRDIFISTDRTGMSKVHYIKFRNLNSLAPRNTRCHFAINVRWLFGWRYISSLNSADEPQEGRNSCPLLRSCFIGHVGVSKRFSRNISLAVYCLYIRCSLLSYFRCRSTSAFRCHLYIAQPALSNKCMYVYIYISSFWLIRSLVDPTLAAFIVCGLLQFVTH